MHSLRQHRGHNTELAHVGVPALQEIVDTAIETRDATKRSLFAQLWQRFQDWRAYRHSVQELSTLDDRILSDIGIHRPEIRLLSRQLVSKRRGAGFRQM